MAIGGSALVGAGASYLGSKKQSDAAKNAANLQMQQFGITNAQQQPYIQSGYGALSRLNTLLGLSPNPNASGNGIPTATPTPMPPNGMTVTNGPTGPATHIPGQIPYMPQSAAPQPQSQGPVQNMQLRQILQLRASHGDRQAAQMLGILQ